MYFYKLLQTKSKKIANPNLNIGKDMYIHVTKEYTQIA